MERQTVRTETSNYPTRNAPLRIHVPTLPESPHVYADTLSITAAIYSYARRIAIIAHVVKTAARRNYSATARLISFKTANPLYIPMEHRPPTLHSHIKCGGRNITGTRYKNRPRYTCTTALLSIKSHFRHYETVPIPKRQ